MLTPGDASEGDATSLRPFSPRDWRGRCADCPGLCSEALVQAGDGLPAKLASVASTIASAQRRRLYGLRGPNDATKLWKRDFFPPVVRQIYVSRLGGGRLVSALFKCNSPMTRQAKLEELLFFLRGGVNVEPILGWGFRASQRAWRPKVRTNCNSSSFT